MFIELTQIMHPTSRIRHDFKTTININSIMKVSPIPEITPKFANAIDESASVAIIDRVQGSERLQYIHVKETYEEVALKLTRNPFRKIKLKCIIWGKRIERSFIKASERLKQRIDLYKVRLRQLTNKAP